MKTKRHIKKNGLRKTKKKRFVYGGTDPVTLGSGEHIKAVQTIVDSGLDISISAEQEGKRELIKYIREQYKIFKQSNIFLRFLYGASDVVFSAENIQSSIIQITTFLQVIMYGKQVNPEYFQYYNGLPDRDIVTLIYFHQRLLLYYKNKALTVEILLAELENLSLPDKSGGTNIYPLSLEDNDIRNIIKIIRAVLIVNTQEPTIVATVATINNILQNTKFLDEIITNMAWGLTDLNGVVLKIICFLDIVAKAGLPELRRELISGMLNNINIISNPDITGILALVGTTSQEERVCVFSDTDLTLEMLESQTKPYFNRYINNQAPPSMTEHQQQKLLAELKKMLEASEQSNAASGTSPKTNRGISGAFNSALKGVMNAAGVRTPGASKNP